MTLSQFCLMALGGLIFIWFALPMFLSTHMNIGNVTGMALAIVFFVYGAFCPVLHRIIAQWREHSVKRWIIWGFLAVALMIAALALIETICMVRAACKKPQEDATVVVLGCRVYGERPSLSLEERLQAAYNYLQEHEEAACIVSGGKGTGEDISEAECMYRYLVDKGIDPSRLYKEDASTTTRENLAFSQKIIETEGLTPQIAIATSEYHEYRAGRIAQSLGMECAAVPARTAIWLLPTYYIRELYAILYEWCGFTF